jgi:hypothetical protein
VGSNIAPTILGSLMSETMFMLMLVHLKMKISGLEKRSEW